jgi:hypothetical protein
MKSFRYGKFDPDDCDAQHGDAFLNLLAQSFGVLKEPLRYIERSATAPTESAIKRIEPHDTAENGRNAYLAWIAHYKEMADNVNQVFLRLTIPSS